MKRSNSTSASNEAGFTLLEILIAITLLAVITISVVSVTENSTQTMERTTEINANNLQIETAMNRFEWDFSQIYSPLYFSTIMSMNQGVNNLANSNENENEGESSIFDGPQAGNTEGAKANAYNPELERYYQDLSMRFERNEHFSALSKEGLPIPRLISTEKDHFEFFTSSNRRKFENQKQSHFAWVRYALAPQDQTEKEEGNSNIPKGLKSFVRYYSADDPYEEKKINIEDVERVKGAVLLRNVESLEFQFWDYQKKKWETSLRSIQGGESLIRGLRILITWYDGSGLKRTATRSFRPLWPMVAPKDQATGQKTATPNQKKPTNESEEEDEE